MFLGAKCLCSYFLHSSRESGLTEFPLSLKDTDGHTNMVKMKENVTDRVRVQSMIGTCILHKKYNFLTKYFPWEKRGTYVQWCAILTQTLTRTHWQRDWLVCLRWNNRQAAAHVQSVALCDMDVRDVWSMISLYFCLFLSDRKVKILCVKSVMSYLQFLSRAHQLYQIFYLTNLYIL